MSSTDFATVSWIVLGSAIAILFACQQLFYFEQNKKRIDALRNFFLHTKDDYATVSMDEVTLIQTIGRKENTALDSLIQEINLYVQKSIGTADFNLIQNKTERRVESMYEHATAEISFPTYYGLMGTFTGTFLGLIGFLISGSDLSDESKVTNLIIGVLVSMLTSLLGLALTTRSNRYATAAKKELDEQKNEFLDFVQLELIPKLQTTITTLQQTMEGFVPKFNVVISNFERTFTGVIGRFKDTFDKCTENFGSEFRSNSMLISQTVGTLNESIGKITSNVENQRLLLQELRSEKMFVTLQQFVTSAETFSTTASSIDGYNMLLQRLLDATKTVIYKQNEFAESLSIPRELVLNIKSLLDRISTFENSVNALGENIAQAEMLGNREIELVNRHIESLNEKKELADRFLDTSNDELKALFQEEQRIVKSIFDSSRHQLEDERDALNVFVRETLQIITKKKADLLSHLEHAFDVSQVHTMFSHLKTLPDIMNQLEELERTIVHGNQLEQYVHNLLDSLGQMRATVTSSFSEQKNAISAERQLLTSVIEAESEKETTSLSELLKRMNEREHEVINELAHLQESMDGGINTLGDEVKSLQTKVDEGEAIIGGKLQSASNQLQSEINRVADATRHLHRDIVKDVGTNISNESRLVRAAISEQGRKTDDSIRTAASQIRQDANQQSAATGKEMANILSNLISTDKQLHEILDAIMRRDKDGQTLFG